MAELFFIRKSRSLELTEAAQAYLPTVDAAFKILYEGTQGLLGVNHDQLLEVRSNLAFSVFWLTPRLGDLFDQYPWINLNMANTLWRSSPAAPYASVEVRFDHVLTEGLSIDPFVQDEFYPVCSPALAKNISAAEDLLGYRLIDVSGMIEGWDKWFAKANLELPPNKFVDKASTYVVTLNMALNGQGIALAHDIIAADLIAKGDLVRLFQISVPMKEQYYLIPPARRNANSASKAFHAWMLEKIEEFRC